MPVAAAPDCVASDITLKSCCNAECIYSHARAPLKAPISLLMLALLFPAGSDQAGAAEGLAMHGSPRETAGFAHFPYVNPDAPKGGRVTFAMQGSYDSLNPLIVKGEPADGVRDYVYESLLARANDEPFTLYGLIAESVETPPDRSYVEFTLDPRAKFSDGVPITVDDVIFSHALLRDHGRPNHRSYYKKVTKVEQTGERKVRFTFDHSGDREMPLIMGLMPVLPKHLIDPDKFETTSLAPPIGSGPYTIAKVDPGKSITFKRDPSYWGRDLPVNRGRNNFDEIRYDYYRDAGSMFEAFKSGLVQLREEDDPTRWTEGYDFPALRDGRVIKEELPLETPAGMSALVFNTRRPLFADPRVREALIKLFDFEWVNRTLYHGQYARTRKLLRALGAVLARPSRRRDGAGTARALSRSGEASHHGRKLRPSRSDGSGENRDGRRAALQLLEQAGYQLKDGKLVNVATGEPFQFEILAATRAQERLLLTYAAALKQVGIEARIRQVDSAQYQRRKQTYDFDMIQYYWPVSLSPGNEQSFRWGSEAAVTEGSFNYAGVKSAAVDAMIEALLKADDERELRLGGARARPRAALGRLCHPAVPSAAAMGRSLARAEAARDDAALRLSDRQLVDRAGQFLGHRR